MSIYEEIEFQFDIIGDEILAWKIYLEWFYPEGIKSAIKRFVHFAIVSSEKARGV